jgi:hypothetical protein
VGGWGDPRQPFRPPRPGSAPRPPRRARRAAPAAPRPPRRAAPHRGGAASVSTFPREGAARDARAPPAGQVAANQKGIALVADLIKECAPRPACPLPPGPTPAPRSQAHLHAHFERSVYLLRAALTRLLPSFAGSGSRSCRLTWGTSSPTPRSPCASSSSASQVSCAPSRSKLRARKRWASRASLCATPAPAPHARRAASRSAPPRGSAGGAGRRSEACARRGARGRRGGGRRAGGGGLDGRRHAHQAARGGGRASRDGALRLRGDGRGGAGQLQRAACGDLFGHHLRPAMHGRARHPAQPRLPEPCARLHPRG